MYGKSKCYIIFSQEKAGTYDHRVWKTGLPVRSAVLKPHAGRLVVGWVTTSESRLLYVFFFFFFGERASILSIFTALDLILRFLFSHANCVDTSSQEPLSGPVSATFSPRTRLRF